MYSERIQNAKKTTNDFYLPSHLAKADLDLLVSFAVDTAEVVMGKVCSLIAVFLSDAWLQTASWAGDWTEHPDIENPYNEHRFLAACREGHTDAVLYFLSRKDFDINGLYPGGAKGLPYSGLYLAAGYGHEHIVQMLLAHGADPDLKTARGRTAIIHAAESAHSQVIDLLIEYGADLNHISDDGDSVLYLASKQGNTPMVQWLMAFGAKHPENDASKPILKNRYKEHGFLAACREGHLGGVKYYQGLVDFDIHAFYRGGYPGQFYTGLYLAAGYGHNHIVKRLVNAGSDPNQTVYGGKSALMNAALFGHGAVVDTLIKCGADVNHISESGDSVIYCASKGGYTSVVRQLVAAGAKHPIGHPFRPVLKNECQEHNFLAACREGHVGGVRYYLDRIDFPINGLYLGTRSKHAVTGLYLAAGCGQNHIVEILLDRGADPEQKVCTGETALVNAVRAGHVEVVKTLLEGGADVDVLSNEGDPLLYLASKAGHTPVIRQLMAAGARHAGGNEHRPILKNRFKEYAFLAACREGHVGGVRYYLGRSGFDINKLYLAGSSECRLSMTGLHLAAGYGHNHIVEILLKNGADPNVKGYEGQTALMNAASFGHKDVVDILLRYRADVGLTSDLGLTALHCAARNGYHQIVERLLAHGANPLCQGHRRLLPRTALAMAQYHRPWFKREEPGSEVNYERTRQQLSSVEQTLEHQQPGTRPPQPGAVHSEPLGWHRRLALFARGERRAELQPLVHSMSSLTMQSKE